MKVSGRTIPWAGVGLAMLLSIAGAQSLSIHQFTIASWGTGDGLRKTQVRDVRRTRDGWLWLATPAGLARFDGLRFEYFTKTNMPGTRSDLLTRLAEDARGGLWIGSEDAGVMRYANGLVKSWTIAEGLPSNSVHALAADPSRGLWVGTLQGLARIENDRVILAEDPVLARANTIALTWGPDGSLWIVTVQQGVFRWSAGGFQRMFAPTEWPFVVSALDIDEQGNVWVGTSSGGLLRIQGDQRQWLTRRNGMSNDTVLSITHDREGRVWAGTEHGLNLILPDLSISAADKKDRLQGDGVESMFADGERNAG